MKRLIISIAFCSSFSQASLTEPNEGIRLHALFKTEWERQLEDDPIMASSLGDKRFNDKWPDVSLAAITRRHEKDVALEKLIDNFKADDLSKDDQLNLALFKRELKEKIEGFQYAQFLIPLNQRGGIQTSDQISKSINFSAPPDYRSWLSRLSTFGTYMDQTIELMREGIRKGMVHPKIISSRLPPQIEKQIVSDPISSPFYRPFTKFPPSIKEYEQTRLSDEAKKEISNTVVPAFRKFHEFLTKEYFPAGYDKVGVWQVPKGRGMYAHLARRFTTTSLSPDEIHKIGVSEVKRIRSEMMKIISDIKFKGSFDEFLNFLRTDPQFYFKTSEELLVAYRDISKRIDPTIVKLFGKLPRIPYGVEPIPDNIAPDTTTAYYRAPSADGSRAGTYFVNLYMPEARPKYEMEALSIHEAVPGHHLQIALANELGELPEFRRFAYVTAFTEGWGLYSESLGKELGFYSDPYSHFGQLTYEMWRAVRLVVDTGMHHMEWSRQKAIDYFMENAPKSKQDIVNEIDRYIAWPGQALAYKIGELKIKELRAKATNALGSKFDIKKFHDAILEQGGLPLDILDTRIQAWINVQLLR